MENINQNLEQTLQSESMLRPISVATALHAVDQSKDPQGANDSIAMWENYRVRNTSTPPNGTVEDEENDNTLDRQLLENNTPKTRVTITFTAIKNKPYSRNSNFSALDSRRRPVYVQ